VRWVHGEGQQEVRGQLLVDAQIINQLHSIVALATLAVQLSRFRVNQKPISSGSLLPETI
jgi:hypothetical protein